jgi:hypothetical protein
MSMALCIRYNWDSSGWERGNKMHSWVLALDFRCNCFRRDKELGFPGDCTAWARTEGCAI